AILPYVEDGIVTLIGATTENPSFEVNSALLSRARVIVLHALTNTQLDHLIERALTDERGLASLNVRLNDEARQHLFNLSDGDARSMLNTLELAASACPPNAKGERVLD